MVKTVAAAAAALTLAGAAFAQEAPAPPCAAPEHRAFDFWIGEWDAYLPAADAPAGRSSIAVEDGGCVITERWTSLNAPYTGRSLSMYDRTTGQWLQIWMDSQGDVTRYVGGPNQAGEMVLVAPGDAAPNQAAPLWQRMTFTANPDGSLRQHGESSPDGVSWGTVYDFTYRRRAE